MDPQQELFSYFLVELKKIYRDMVFDGYMPPENTPYPFIYIADSQQTDDLGNKTAIFNDVYQTIHIWSDTPKKRGTVSKMAYTIKQLARSLEYTSNYKWDVRNADQRILTDTTTSTPLMHCIIEFGFKSSPKAKKIQGGKTSE